MTLREQLDEDLKTALKGGDSARVSTLRMLKAAVGNQAIQKGKATLEDAEILDVIRKEMKQHTESVEAFTQGRRADLAKKETRELEILKGYLPAQMEEKELREIIQGTIRELGISGPAAMGPVMKALMPKVGGRADGKRINQLVRELLG